MVMMGYGVESCRTPNSEHAGECMETDGNNPSYNSMENLTEFQSESPEESVMGESECEVVRENSMLVSNSTAASEIVFEAGNFTVVSMSSSHGSNSSSQLHVCRFCNKVFSSGKAMGGHVRIHGVGRSKKRSSSSGNVSRADNDVWVKKSKVPTSRSNGNSNWIEALEGDEADEHKEEKDMNVSVEERELSDQKTVSLYTLRRNPKRSRRLNDEDFSMDLTAKNTVACAECGKEFPSSKALFGHMRCHPERDWRGIQLPNESHCNTIGGDIVLHASAAAPSSGFSSICWQSSQGSEDVEAKEASDNESDRESMESTRVAHHPASCSLLSWSVTGKRGRRRPIRFTQPKEEDYEYGEEEVEVDNTKELEDDRDTAHFLVMLASSASNTINTNEANRQVQEESAHQSKKGKSESNGSLKGSKAGQEDLGKMKKRAAKTSRLAELGVVAGNYECSTCKKLFNTRRALRSHRSSHKKVKGGSAIVKVKEEEMTEKGNGVLMIDYHPSAVNDMYSSPSREEKKSANNLNRSTEERRLELAIQVKKEPGHECCICHKVFLSGQALGGHKRCHRIVDSATERAESVTSSEKKPKLLRDQVREPLFDLNQPAPAEEDDLEAAYAMVEVGPAEVLAIDTGFRYVECNMCGCLCTSMDDLRAHQSNHHA